MQSFFTIEIDQRYHISSTTQSSDTSSVLNTSLGASFISIGGVSSTFSIITDPSSSSGATKPTRLYGGDKYKNRLKAILVECRKIDPLLPTWDSLVMGSNHFIDKYGFKYNKNNEAILFQYLCQQLSIFFDNQPNFREDKFWQSKIKEWRIKFVKTNEVKQIVRNGIPSR